MSTAPRSSLDKRKSPVQARSQQRVQQILDSTRSLLKEQGFAGVTTAKIAAHAEIPVGSLYQYYPNKKAIMMALYEDYLVKVRQIFVKFQSPEYLALGWEVFFTKLFTAVHKAELRDEIEDELEKAFTVYPELADIDRQHREKIADIMVGQLRELGSRWSKAKLRRMAHYSYEINSGIWAYRVEEEPPAKELLDWNLSVAQAMMSKCFE